MQGRRDLLPWVLREPTPGSSGPDLARPGLRPILPLRLFSGNFLVRVLTTDTVPGETPCESAVTRSAGRVRAPAPPGGDTGLLGGQAGVSSRPGWGASHSEGPSLEAMPRPACMGTSTSLSSEL